LTIASGGILQTTVPGASGATINVGPVFTGNNQDLIVINNDTTAGGAITINSAINTGTTLGLTKSGAGAMVLGSANTYSGNTNLNGGATTLTNSLALQNSTVNFNLQGGTLSFGTLTSATFGGLNGNQALSLGAVALTVGGNNADTTYGGTMSGAGSVSKVGNGTLTLTGPNTYTGATTVGSGGDTSTVTLADTGRIASATVLVNAGATLHVNGTLTGTPDVTAAGSGGVGSTITIGANDSTNNPNFTSVSPILVRNWNSLTVGSGSSVSMDGASSHADRSVLVLNSATAPLTFSDPAGGTLNLSNNDMIVRNGNVAAIAGELKSGFNAPTGYWNGTAGIVSSAAASDTSFLTTIGYRSGGAAFDGVTTSSSDVVVKYTYYGDADLSGTVDGADYQQIDNGFGLGLTGWSNGDFNYDGVVNGSDFALIDNTFNQITATGATALAIVASPAAIGVSTSAVPEPTTLGLLGIGAMGLLGRRRRRHA
jgi:autotransporter-associated beta strand protein